jgi:hypothetical protein
MKREKSREAPMDRMAGMAGFTGESRPAAAAARELEMSHSSVTTQINELESGWVRDSIERRRTSSTPSMASGGWRRWQPWAQKPTFYAAATRGGVTEEGVIISPKAITSSAPKGTLSNRQDNAED